MTKAADGEAHAPAPPASRYPRRTARNAPAKLGSRGQRWGDNAYEMVDEEMWEQVEEEERV